MGSPYDTREDDAGRHARALRQHEDHARRCAEADEHDAPLYGNLRDAFAMAALTGVLAADTKQDYSAEAQVEDAYRIADLMLKARKLKP